MSADPNAAPWSGLLRVAPAGTPRPIWVLVGITLALLDLVLVGALAAAVTFVLGVQAAGRDPGPVWQPPVPTSSCTPLPDGSEKC